MNTQYRKNLKAVAQACKDYTDEKIKKVYYDIGHNDITTDDHTNEPTYRFTAPANAKLMMLQSIAGNSVKYAPTTASDSTTAYQKTIPSYSPSIDRASASMNILGGMSYKVNQLINKDNLPVTQTISDVTITNNADGSLSLSGTASADISLNLVAYTIKANFKYLLCGAKGGSANAKLYAYGSGVSSSDTGSGVIVSNTSETYIVIRLVIANGTNVNGLKFIPMLFDLTADFGSGNEPASVSDCATEYAKRGIDIYSYTPQQSAIRDTAPTSVVSKDSNDTTIDTLTIDNNIQALNGYGWGIDDTCYNYIDFNAKKFVKKVDKRAYQSGDEEDTSVLTDLTTTYYELATPIETDISQYLDGNEIEIEPNGTLSFESTYSAYVPSNVSYNGVIKHSLATAVKQEGANLFSFNNVTISKDSQSVLHTINSDNSITITNNLSESSRIGFSFDYIGPISISFVPSSNQGYFVISTLSVSSNFNSSGNTINNINYSGNYISLYVNANTTITINNFAINRGSTALSYRPYKPTITRLLPNSEAKYSWGITDGVRNTRIFCDDEGNAVNEGSLDVNSLDLGTRIWNKDGDNRFYNRYGNDLKTYPNADVGNILCYKYNSVKYTDISSRTNEGIAIAVSSNINTIFVYDLNINDTNVFKNTNDGNILYYQKNATDTETLDDFDYFFDCEEGDTFTIIGCELLQCYATYSFLIKEAKSNE